MRVLLLVSCLFGPGFVWADIAVTNRTVRAKEIINLADIEVIAGEVPGAIQRPVVLVGQEAKTALYPGRPIFQSNVGPPAIVDRNDLVTLVFIKNGLSIMADGRALGRGAVGDRIRVMNLTSRATITGEIRSDGQIEVN
ncbi:MAG: flagellar basal body P-ring formation chaperone FlgA [Ruegeria sp.]